MGTVPESSEDDPDAEGSVQSPDRLITLADGIFAIAMTLLVLNISVPSGLDHDHFRSSLHETWSRLATYALSFAIIGGQWLDHHRVFRLVKRTNTVVVRLTLLLLGLVALLPFPTALLSDYGGHEPLAVVYYAVTVGAINLLLLGLFLTVRNDERLQARPISDRFARGMIADCGATIAIAAVAVLVALTVSAGAGLFTWLAAFPAGMASRRLRKES
ncbi:protein of unknown function DUF1211 [Catenulispora acidiphila DSM 44928]|uniref:Integral membrane protein n=1 Tax=Catenulispora acidiphila (strain DSM 44928 / JCM 14897 / NBRC 102108 / NRRL B-24433 / ID139908) TaxID=479433 RepID=C7QFE6_CATAD|nr:protein of unknown function DUF1211 [Catenulispora acidiphila DSM 44928]